MARPQELNWMDKHREQDGIRYGAVVIYPAPRITDYGSLLAIARVDARKKEGVNVNINVKAIVFVPELGIYVGVYRLPNQKELLKPSVTRRGRTI